MEWRCKWCGKPHEENAPPCDNCGHSKFERTTVPVSDLGGPEQLEWVCTECGRSHPRNSPPCSRCGNTTLERQQLDYDDLEVGSTGYLDLASLRYLLAAGATVVLAAVLVLGATGVVDIPGTALGQPSVSGVPGQADAAGNLSLADVEAELVAALNDRRRDAGHAALDRDGTLADVAGYLNRRYVKAAYAGGERPDLRAAFEGFGASCPRTPSVTVFTSASRPSADVTVGTFDSEAALADAIARAFARTGRAAGADRATTGVDVHVAPDGVVYVTRIVC